LLQLAAVSLARAKPPAMVAQGAAVLATLCARVPAVGDAGDPETFADIVELVCAAAKEQEGRGGEEEEDGVFGMRARTRLVGGLAALSCFAMLFRRCPTLLAHVGAALDTAHCIGRLCAVALCDATASTAPIVFDVVGQLASVSYKPAVVLAVCLPLVAAPWGVQRAMLCACPLHEPWLLDVADTLLSTSHLFRISADPTLCDLAFRLALPSYAKVEGYLFHLRPVSSDQDSIEWLVWLVSFVLHLLALHHHSDTISPTLLNSTKQYVSSLTRWYSSSSSLLLPMVASTLLSCMHKFIPA
jgi:hypothetical protein